MHHEPPEVAALCPPLVLLAGAELVEKPALLLLLVLVLLLLVLLVLLVVLVLVVFAWAVDPGSARATTPAATTLVAPTAAVAERTLAWPRALAATARPILSRFMGSILGPAGRRHL
jgi:uncharacterized membrane protein YqjE